MSSRYLGFIVFGEGKYESSAVYVMLLRANRPGYWWEKIL
jgi:hypothetical protein